jgi:branched-chain amino acid transport system substrate-binding protein
MRRSLRHAGAAAIALTTLSSLTGCGSPEAESVGSVKVGLVTPLSGDSATFGNSAQQGAQLAVELLNDADQTIGLPLLASGSSSNVLGPSLELIVANTGSDSEKAADAVSSLVNDSEITVLVGAYDDEATAAASQRAEELHVPLVNVDSARADLTEHGLHWFFRMGPSDRTLSETFLGLLEQINVKLDGESRRVGIAHPVTPTESAMSLNVSEVVTAAGYDVVDLQIADENSELESLVREDSAVDAVIAIALDVEAAAEIAIRLRDIDALDTSAMIGMGRGFENDGFAARAQGAADDFLIVTDWTPELAQRGGPATELADLYLQRFSTPLTGEAAASFTAVYAIARGVDGAESVDRTQLRDAISALNIPGREVVMPWDGVRFDETQQNSGARGVVSQLVGDTQVLVYPFELAREAVRWPAATGTR